MSHTERVLTGCVAVVAWTGVLLQADVSFHLMLGNGLALSDALIRFFSYFTVLTNSFIALETTLVTVTGETRWSRSLLRCSVATCLAVSILLVGGGYFVLLRHLLHLTGNALLASTILHDAVPLIYLGYWCLYASRHRLKWSDANWWFLYPLLYFLYVLGQGWRTGLYPYPFIDAARIGYRATFVNGTALLASFWACGFVFVRLGRLLHRP
jgi:hypothetical protein